LFRKIAELLAAAQLKGQQNWIFILKVLSDVSFTNPTSTVGLQLLNLWLRKAMLKWVNDGVMITKLDIGQLETRQWCDQMSRSSRSSLNHSEFTFREQPRKPKIRNPWFQHRNTRKLFWWFGQQYRGTVFCWSHYYPLWPN
jgi:hypothetical protein